MKKRILISLFVLLHCHLSLSMLIKQLYHFPQHAKTVHSKNINLIHNIFKNNPIVKNINDMPDYDDRDDIDVYDYEEELKDLYFRDENIIKILHEDIKDIRKKQIQEIKEIRKKISTLKKQQDLAVLGLAGNTDRIYELEGQLHTSFNINKECQSDNYQILDEREYLESLRTTLTNIIHNKKDTE